MNAPMTAASLLPAELPATTDTAALILQGDAMDRIERFAKLMSTGKLAVPRHFMSQPADCFAVCLQAMQWRMNPFAVAQKTFIAPSGALGYEGTLVAAALSTSGALEGDLRYEYIGDWTKVRGKFEKRESPNRGNGSTEPKYYIVPTYTKADEDGLGVRAIGRLRGEREDRVVELYLSQCYPRFSTQWANNPEQQIVYAVDRVWARRHKPSVMLGVYTEDELGEASPPEKHMGPADVVPPAAPQSYPQDQFDKNLPQWTQVLASGRKDHDKLIAFIETKGMPLTDAQKKKLRALPVGKAEGATAADAPQDVTPKGGPSADDIETQLAGANDQEALATAGSFIASVTDPARRASLTALYEKRGNELPPF
jgi:hypothetical protein